MLGVSYDWVNNRLRSLRVKSGKQTNAQLVMWATNLGYWPPDEALRERIRAEVPALVEASAATAGEPSPSRAA